MGGQALRLGYNGSVCLHVRPSLFTLIITIPGIFEQGAFLSYVLSPVPLINNMFWNIPFLQDGLKACLVC